MTRSDYPSRIITSRNHPILKRIRSLHRREERDRSGLFFIEGIRFVAQAMWHGAHVETLLVSPPLLANPFGQKLARRLRRAGVPCLEVSPEVFHSVALTDEPQGIGAVTRQRWESLARANPSEGLCWVAVDSVRSPGNLGTLLRTADAVGSAGLILIGDSVDPYDPAAVRATMGALFSQHLVRATLGAFTAWKERHRCLLVGTSPTAAVDYQAAAYPQPVVLFMGGERRGLPQEHQELCDLMVRIPMVGSSDSLNLAIATSLMLYEVFNQRRAVVHAGS
jgi:TrmH family RNA methyltransferase